MSEYVKTYIAGKVKNMITRPGMTLLQEGLYVSGQLTEDEIEVGQRAHALLHCASIELVVSNASNVLALDVKACARRRCATLETRGAECEF
eukprot:3914076-Rhodomonas_salina.2